MKKTKSEKRIQGVSASPGIAIGKIFLMSSAFVRVEQRLLAEDEIDREIENFLRAVENAKEDLQTLQKQTAESLGDESARIFEAHQLMLQDELIIEESVRRIREQKTNSDFVFFFPEIVQYMKFATSNYVSVIHTRWYAILKLLPQMNTHLLV